MKIHKLSESTAKALADNYRKTHFAPIIERKDMSTTTENQTKHTPGPWYAANMGNDHQGLVVSEATGANIAVTYDKRDAALVATAPALLEACKLSLEWIEQILGQGASDSIRCLLTDTQPTSQDGTLAKRFLVETIAKAEGEA